MLPHSLFVLSLCLSTVEAFPNLLPRKHEEPISTLVDLGYSQYQGVSLSAGVNQYLGMRFAAAPVDDLRWRAPQDPPKTNVVQPANAFGPICLGVFNTVTPGVVDEDCLFVNVFTPANATTKSKLPVWFYIQGGGYADNSNANYNGTEVVQASNHSILLVNMNYRVGAFGFLASEKVREDGSLNNGLLDQRKAMEWVQKYIHLFGGDPNHVVIHGASAGAGSIAHHLTAYGGRNDHLFVGAVAESPFFPTQRTVAEMEFQFNRFAKNVSCNPKAADVMSCLRSKDTATLQSADTLQPFPTRVNSGNWYFLPVIDGEISQDLLYNELEQGRIVRVPTIVGDDTSEGEGFAVNAATNAQFLQFMKDNYPKLNRTDLHKINVSYPITPPRALHNAWFGAAAEAYGDSTFTCAGNEMSSSVAAFLSPKHSWNYHYDVPDPFGVALGDPVPHTTETPAIFGPDATFCGNCSYAVGNVNHPMVAVVMPYFISFVKSLNPNTFRNPTTPVWDPLGKESFNRLHFVLNDTGMEVAPQEQLQRCELWKSLATTMEQ